MGTVSTLALDNNYQEQNAREDNEMKAMSERSDVTSKKKARNKISYIRRTIELHPELEKMLDNMQAELKVRSHTEVLQKAIQLLAVILGEDGAGRKRIFIENSEGQLQEILII